MTQLQRIQVDLIDSPIQTRPYSETHAKGLMASIKAEGLHAPIKVFQRGDRYVLGPGMHRLMAVRMLGDTDIDAVVDAYESDEQVRSAQRAENILRENMTPMQEALAIEQAMNDSGGSEQVVANSLGRPMAWVQARLALLALTTESREALDQGRISLRHAQLLAKISDPDKRNLLLGECASSGRPGMHVGKDAKGKDEYGTGMSTDALAARIAAIQQDLGDVDWNLTDRFGKNNRDCATCPSNSKNRPELFLDQKPGTAVCGDRPCFEDKKVVARLGARRVAFTLVKSGHTKPSEGQVAEAAASRDASYVSVAAVKKALKSVVEMKNRQKKSAGKPGATDKKADKAEAFKVQQAKDERTRQIRRELNAQLEKWDRNALKAVLESLKGADFAPAYMLLLSAHPLWDKADGGRLNKPSPDRTAFIHLLKGAQKAKTAADLAPVARTLEFAPSKENVFEELFEQVPTQFTIEHYAFSETTHLVAIMVEAFGVDTMKLGPKPTVQEVTAKLFPPEPKKPEAKASVKTKPKKKAA